MGDLSNEGINAAGCAFASERNKMVNTKNENNGFIK